MSTVIISYDGSPNDDDALALGKLFGQAGASLELAYVRHWHDFHPDRERLAEHDAERRLQQGASLLGDPDIPQHVVFSASTGTGLEELAESEGASMIVFGSDYRTSPGRAEPNATAQSLLDGAGVAIAVAAAGLRGAPDATIRSIALLSGDDGAAAATGDALAAKLDATLVSAEAAEEEPVDLVLVGSQPTAPPGRIALSGRARGVLNSTRGSVLVVPVGKPVEL